MVSLTPRHPVRAGNTDKRKYKNGYNKTVSAGNWKRSDNTCINNRLVSRQKQDRATSYLTHKFGAFVNKNLNGTNQH